MPIELLAEFLTSIFFVLILSALFLLITLKSPSSNPLHNSPEPDDDEQPPEPGGLEELAEEIERDEQLHAAVIPVEVPHIDLPGIVAGGGAADEACSKVTGKIVLKESDTPDDKRTYNRRLKDRRTSDAPVENDQRVLERRIWLRREEDKRGKKLLTVTDAAETLGVPVEQIYKWLDKVDIPFYQVTDGKKKAIRFEVNELLQWYTAFVSSNSNE